MKKVVLIIGAGFAGLTAARALAKDPELRVALVDQKNHHLFQPLLYQVATAGLNPSDIAVPIRAQFADAPNVEVHMGRVTKVHLQEKWIAGEGVDVRVPFDFLVIACGAQHSYFGRPEWETFAPGLKTLEQATEIRRRILLAFETAENERDPEKQRALLTFVVVGGGPTGVELAGAIADISRTVLVRDFRHINPASARIVLLEASPSILASFPKELSERATRDLRALGVEVRSGTRVEHIDAEGVTAAGEKIAARSVFWGAGVRASQLSYEPALDLDRAGRVKVTSDFSVPGHPEVFVIGDMASLELSDGTSLPGLAPAAVQGGHYVARAIASEIRGRSHAPFRYRNKGQMATIGKHKAIALSGGLKMTGFLAWVAWLFVHIFYLIGFKNRLTVFIIWSWSYLFSQRGSRLITEHDWKLKS